MDEINKYIAIIDLNGWLNGIVMYRGDYDYSLYPDHTIIELKREEAFKLQNLQNICYWDGGKFNLIKDPLKIFKRLRNMGLGGNQLIYELNKCISINNHEYEEEIPEWKIGINNKIELSNKFFENFSYNFFDGLKIEVATLDDIELWTNQMIKSGLYNQNSALEEALKFFSGDFLPLKTVWKNEIIQIETYGFDKFKSQFIYAHFTDHIDRVRPWWFWQLMARPVFEKFLNSEIFYIKTVIRKDRREWVDFLKKAYNAIELGEDERGYRLYYSIEKSLENMLKDWPERQSLGADWKFEKDGVLVREGREEDFSILYQAMDESWGINPRKELALKILEDRWILDRASLLLAFKDNKIIDALVIRKRSDPSINLTSSPLRWMPQDIEAFDTAWIGFLLWQKEAGYTESSFIAETKLDDIIERNWGTRGYSVYQRRNDITEWRINIDNELNKRLE